MHRMLGSMGVRLVDSAQGDARAAVLAAPPGPVTLTVNRVKNSGRPPSDLVVAALADVVTVSV